MMDLEKNNFNKKFREVLEMEKDNIISSKNYYKGSCYLTHLQGIDSIECKKFSNENYATLIGNPVYSDDFRPSMLKDLMNSKRHNLMYKIDEYSKYVKFITYKTDRKSFIMKHIEYGKEPKLEQDLSYEDILERLNYHGDLHKVNSEEFFSKASVGFDNWLLYEDRLGVKVTLVARKVLKNKGLESYSECINVYGAIENTAISLYTGEDAVINITNISQYTEELAKNLSNMLDAKIQITKK